MSAAASWARSALQARWMTVLFALLCLVAQALGAPLPQDNSPPVSIPTPGDVRAALGADIIVVSIIFIVTGLIFVFWGGKMFRVCLFLPGAYLFTVIAYSVLARVEAQGGAFNNNRKAVYLGVGFAAAIIGGALFTFFYKLGIFAIGAFGGYTFALWVLTLKSGGLIEGQTGQAVFIAVCALVAGALVFVVEPHVIRIGTAFGGAYLMFVGIDNFAQTGFSSATSRFLGSNLTDYQASSAVYGMLAGTLALALLGCFVQYRHTSRGKTSYKSIRG